ncbi:hypothetical protein [Novosphingobium resinovorum]|uniref:Uncharacterized protein n=1 Tax=Novosphingobium resinovorum TaxID=158500 RepID=A0A1D8A394_9SPHN|nr:hypothetical protein [Novosphingobium resinovorum]AOR76532.1 hypothetical protein BES08_07080 [Novosphingobium resinovorum]
MTIYQVSMILWFAVGLLLFGRLIVGPRMIRLDAMQCRRVATYAFCGVIGEALTLWLGGFFHV